MYRAELLSRSYRVFLLDDLEQYEDRISLLSDRIEQGESTSAAFNNRGLAYSEIGQIDEALQDFEKATQVDPSNPYPHINKADLFKRIGRLAEAVESCSAAIAVKKDVTFLRTRAHLLIDIGRLKEALSDLDEAVNLEPGHTYTLQKREEIRQQLA